LDNRLAIQIRRNTGKRRAAAVPPKTGFSAGEVIFVS